MEIVTSDGHRGGVLTNAYHTLDSASHGSEIEISAWPHVSSMYHRRRAKCGVLRLSAIVYVPYVSTLMATTPQGLELG